MAGHSKWANIKFRKSLQDSRRGKIFTKLIREITISTRLGGGDVNSNPRLRAAVEKALSQNMTRETIDRAIKRGIGDASGNLLEEIRYEGHGAGGGAVIVECMTDNRKRTVSEVRHLFNKFGGNLGTDGSVSYLFRKRGQILFEPGSVDEEPLLDLALDAGAEDLIVAEDGSLEIVTDVEHFEAVRDKINQAKIIYDKAELGLLPESYIQLNADQMQTFIKLIDGLEDLDDVQTVHYNVELEYPD